MTIAPSNSHADAQSDLPTSKKGGLTKLHRIIAAALLLWVTIAGLWLAWRDSLTTDEDVHMASGYTILTRHDFRFDPEHPPLFKALTAAPLLFLHLNPPPDDQALWKAAQPTFFDSWQQARKWGDEWTYISGNPANEMKFLARIPSVLSLIGLCWLLYYLGREWFSPKVGLWTLFFAAFNPTLLAHGHLANDDVAIACAIVGSIVVFYRYIKNPTLLNAFWVGLVTVITICTKYTGLGLLVIFALYLIGWGISQRQGRRTLGHALLMLATIWLGIWICYGFHSPIYGTAGDLMNYQNASKIPPALTVARIMDFARVIRYILPTAFVKGFILVGISTKYGRGAYLFGHHFWPSIWYYFPAVFTLKTQLIALGMFLVGGIAALRNWRAIRENLGYQILTLSLVIFIALSMTNKLDLGIRHITPADALLMPCLGLIAAQLARTTYRYYVYGVVIIAYSLPVVLQLPYIIGYVNLLVQPYDQAWRYMSDCNIDWGQQAQEAANLVKTEFHDETVATNYPWNPYQLAYYGMKTESLDTKILPTDTLIMVTGNQLSGSDYKAFRSMTPVATIADNTYFYRIPSQ